MSQVAHSVKSSLLAAFRYLLKPLVRMAVKSAVTFPEFSLALKQAYVDVASRQLRLSQKTVTAEGIFVISSIEPAEVVSILSSNTKETFDVEVRAQSPLPRALAAWHTDARYTGPYGVLLDLDFERSPGSKNRDTASFSDLAASYCPGVPPRALLDELVRSGCVQEVGKGVYRAVTRSYVPDPLSGESIRHIARVVHNLCETLEKNLRPESAGGNGLIERTVYTRHGVTQERIKEFDKYLRQRAQLFANDIDDWLTTHQEREETETAIKTGVGFYHYLVNDDDERAFLKELPIEGD